MTKISRLPYSEDYEIQGQVIFTRQPNSEDYLMTVINPDTGNLTLDNLKIKDGTSALPSLSFASEQTLGIYRPSAGNLSIMGGNVGIGSITAGNNLSIVATLGTELITAPMVTGGWTLGYDTGGWAITAGVLAKTASTETLFATAVTGMTSAPTAGVTYKVTIVSSAASGSTTYTLGGVTGTTISAATTTTDYITAATTAKIIFSGAAATTVSLTSISVKALTDATGDLTVQGNLKLGSPIQNIKGQNVITIGPPGNVGIGTATPGALIHIYKGASGVTAAGGSNLIVESNTNNYISILAPNTSERGLLFGQPSGSYRGAIFYEGITGKTDMMDFRTGAAIRMVIDNSGNVGIGTMSPAGQLSTGLTNGQQISYKSLTELTTIAAAATTDTTIQIPANVIVKAVQVRVTTVIPTAVTFTVTGAISTTVFNTAAVSTAATTTDKGNLNCSYNNGAAQAIRITPNETPADNTGRVRVTIWYEDSIPATS